MDEPLRVGDWVKFLKVRMSDAFGYDVLGHEQAKCLDPNYLKGLAMINRVDSVDTKDIGNSRYMIKCYGIGTGILYTFGGVLHKDIELDVIATRVARINTGIIDFIKESE